MLWMAAGKILISSILVCSSLHWAPFVKARQSKNFRNSFSQLLTLLHSSFKFTVVQLTSFEFLLLLHRARKMGDRIAVSLYLSMGCTYDVWQSWLSKNHTVCPYNASWCNVRDGAALSQPHAPTSSPTPLRFLTFNHACSSPCPVHSLCLYVRPVMWEPLRPCVLSHVTVSRQRRRPCHVSMYNLIIRVYPRATKPNVSAT